VTLALLAASLALVPFAAAAPKPKHAKPAKTAAKPKPAPGKPAGPRTWPKTICGQLVPTVRSISGAQVQANIQKQGGATVLDCRYTTGGIDSAFLLESKQVPRTWLTQSQAQLAAAETKLTCGDLATPAAVPMPLAGVGDAAFGLDACPGSTFTNKAMGQLDVYALKGTSAWWIVAQPPFATTTTAKLAALLKKLIATYP
jgi:hypothetical protein